MKRIFMAVAVALPIILSIAGAPRVLSAPSRTPARATPAAFPGRACPGYSGFRTWSSSYETDFALSNDGYKTGNGVPILTYRWLNQVNQCFLDYALSDGNVAEEVYPVAGSDCMEDPGWKFNAGIDQYSCRYSNQLNVQWDEYSYNDLCPAHSSYYFALRNDGNNQYVYFNAQNGTALLRDYGAANTRECWW
jgi:hypothetical protein